MAARVSSRWCRCQHQQALKSRQSPHFESNELAQLPRHEMTGDKSKGRETVVNRLCEFLVVATHAILYIHEVYPQRIFVMRQKYGVATFYSKHPDVNDYIARTVTSMRKLFQDDLVESIAVVVYDGATIRARYVFETSILAREEDVTAKSMGELENQLRAHLCRLLCQEAPDPARDRARDVVREGRRFEYVLHTKGVRTGETWMPADGKERGEVSRDCEIHPIKDADRFSTCLQMCSRLEVSEQE